MKIIFKIYRLIKSFLGKLPILYRNTSKTMVFEIDLKQGVGAMDVSVGNFCPGN